ncbi:MAG: outer membrane protein assembly factor BamB [Woeseiaceae bacterium]
MTHSPRIVCLVIATLLVSGCSMFGKKDKELEPTKLVDIETTIDVRKLWSAKLGDDAEHLRVMLRPAGDGNRVFAASRDGNVVALDAETGKQAWKTELELELSAGPGVGNGMVAVGSADGLIIILNSNDGTELWRANLSGEVLAPPLIEDDSVIVATIDNRLRALRGYDGEELWNLEKKTPALTMRGSATPVIAGNTVIAGFDNGRLIAANVESGDIVWDSFLAPPSGRSDLDRLSDIDGHISVVGQDIYAAGYQGRLSAVAAESGQILWSRDISSYVGVSADWNSVYTTDDDGEVIALTRNTGQESWRQDSLLRREPTLPVSFSTTVVVGDLDGYLHFFSVVDGVPVARLRQGSAAISSKPVVIAGRLYVQSDAGTLAAYMIKPPKAAPAATDAAEDEGA